MKAVLFVAPLLALCSCKQILQNGNAAGESGFSANRQNITANWAEQLDISLDPSKDSIWEQPVQYYLDQPACSPLAISFYRGEFPLGNNDSTSALFALAYSQDITLRPFYRWCLTKAMQLQDGALAQQSGAPARKYAEEFPNEFFHYMDGDESGERYRFWADAIGYSGYTEDATESYTAARNTLVRNMKKNCLSCNEQMDQRIAEFAADCYPQ